MRRSELRRINRRRARRKARKNHDGDTPTLKCRMGIYDGNRRPINLMLRAGGIRQWVELAHDFKCGVHVGRIGAPDKMVLAHLAGVDSIDSTTWVQRNGSLEHHVKEYRERVGE